METNDKKEITELLEAMVWVSKMTDESCKKLFIIDVNTVLKNSAMVLIEKINTINK